MRQLVLGSGLLVWLVGCRQALAPTPTATPPPVTLRVGFDELVRPLAEDIIPIYGDETPEVIVETEFGNADDLMEGLTAGRIDAALVPGESALQAELWTTAVAIDGVALVVNPDNQVKGLGLSQVRGVFQGLIWLWQDVGGAPAEIDVVTSGEGLSAWDLFQELVMQESQITLTATVLPDPRAVVDYVAAHSWAIGYVGAATVDDRVSVLAVEGLFPTPDALVDGSYPLRYPVYLVIKQEPSGPARTLPAWLMSRDGQAVIAERYGRVR